MTKTTHEPAIRHRTRRAEPELGITADDVVDVIRLTYEQDPDDDHQPWPEFLRDLERYPSLWNQYFMDPNGDFSSFGDNAAKARAVMKVAAVILEGPGENTWTRLAANRQRFSPQAG